MIYCLIFNYIIIAAIEIWGGGGALIQDSSFTGLAQNNRFINVRATEGNIVFIAHHKVLLAFTCRDVSKLINYNHSYS